MNKVLLILVDGMRPDGLLGCGNPFVETLLSHSRYTLQGRTVMPSLTLTCHMSLFHSVPPERHGILTNTYVPQVRPVRGLCEAAHDVKKTCAFFYNWEALKDLSLPGALAWTQYISGHQLGYEMSNPILTDSAISCMQTYHPDFTFLYLGWTDSAGHAKGWMSDEYLRAVSCSVDSIKKCIEAIPDDTLVVVTADHGGHARAHGTDMPEDMTIPVLFYNKSFEKKELEDVSILDIVPTIASVLGVPADEDWEGKVIPL